MTSPLKNGINFGIINFTSAILACTLSQDFSCLGYSHRVENGDDWLRKKPTRPYADAHIILVCSDGKFQKRTVELIARLARKPWICVLHGKHSTISKDLMRASTEFMRSPWSQAELAVRLERFVAQLVPRQISEPTDTAGLDIVGSAPVFLQTLVAARRAATSAAPVIIEGETGTGKELIARLVHRLSDRSRRSFVPVNCGCLPAELVENELFGHEAGAYTGATTARKGLVHQAERGTLFLDEVDALLPRAQIALLRFLQQGEVRPVGGAQMHHVDVRIIAATNQSLADLTAAGKFREDLYYRLNVLELVLPPIRKRRTDIAALTQHFLNVLGATYGRSGLALSGAAMDWIMSHDLPGNVRQLENLIHRAVHKADGPRIGLTDMVPKGTMLPAEPAVVQSDGRETFASAKARAVSAFERHYLTTLMQEARGNVTTAAIHARKERRALGRLLKKHGLDGAQFR